MYSAAIDAKPEAADVDRLCLQKKALRNGSR